jgi:hypothetical protein
VHGAAASHHEQVSHSPIGKSNSDVVRELNHLMSASILEFVRDAMPEFFSNLLRVKHVR